MTNEFFIYLDLTLESYINQDKYFNKYKDLMDNELENMDIDELTDSLNKLKEKLNVLLLERETGLYVGSYGNDLNANIKKKYSDILKQYSLKQHFYAQEIIKLETMIKSKEIDYQR